MRQLRPADKHLEQWIKVEHYRLHCAEQWPESDYKEAALAAIRSTLKALEATSLRRLKSPAAWFAHPLKVRQWCWNCDLDHNAAPQSRGWRREGQSRGRAPSERGVDAEWARTQDRCWPEG